jgi:hypothetical protein
MLKPVTSVHPQVVTMARVSFPVAPMRKHAIMIQLRAVMMSRVNTLDVPMVKLVTTMHQQVVTTARVSFRGAPILMPVISILWRDATTAHASFPVAPMLWH